MMSHDAILEVAEKKKAELGITDKSKIGDVGAEKAGRNDSSLKHLKRSVVPQGDADDEWN